MEIAYGWVGRRGGVYAARAIVWLPQRCRAGYTLPLRPHTEGAVQEPYHGGDESPPYVLPTRTSPQGTENSGSFSTIRAFPVEKWFGVSLPTFFAKKVGGKSPLGRSTFAVRVFITCSHSVYFGAVIHCVKGLSTLKMLKTLWKEWKTTPVFRLKMWKTRWKALCRAVLVPKFSTGGLWRPGRGLTRPRYLCTIRIIQNCAKE